MSTIPKLLHCTLFLSLLLVGCSTQPKFATKSFSEKADSIKLYNNAHTKFNKLVNELAGLLTQQKR